MDLLAAYILGIFSPCTLKIEWPSEWDMSLAMLWWDSRAGQKNNIREERQAKNIKRGRYSAEIVEERKTSGRFSRIRITYNAICRSCTYDCKQSFRALLDCPRYEGRFGMPWKKHRWTTKTRKTAQQGNHITHFEKTVYRATNPQNTQHFDTKISRFFRREELKIQWAKKLTGGRRKPSPTIECPRHYSRICTT